MQPALRLDPSQQQTLSPRLQHAVRLLQLSSLDFTRELHELVDRNPFLEQDENEAGVSDLETVSSLSGIAATQLSEQEAPQLSGFELGAIEPTSEFHDTSRLDGEEGSSTDRSEHDSWTFEADPPTHWREDGQLGALDLMPVRTGLRTHLHSQLNVLPLPLRDLLLAKPIVESLDDDGYLRQPLDELLADLPIDLPFDVRDDEELAEPPCAEELLIALKRVQSLEPAGVGARSVAECLLLQLPAIACPQMREDARRIVSQHIDCLAARDVPRLAQLLGTSTAQVESVCERIRRLDPHPGWRFDATHTPYVTPDIVVKRVRGQWTALLNPGVVPRLRVNEVYAELFQRHRRCHPQGRQDHPELVAHLQEARWTLRNVEQRFVTILSVAQAITQHQRHFFELGPMAMKPLVLKEIARETGMHESTVSRVTSNKYMATPLGVFELKYFFSRAMTSASGSAFSGTAIRGLIKDMIDEERPETPLSDAQIARALAQQGLTVARRTVTKYRQALRIAAVERRRVHG